MRSLFFVLPLTLLAAAAVRADEATDLRDRVIKAHAKDPADLKKFKVHTVKAKGEFRPGSDAVAATFEMAAVYPGRMKLTWEFGTGATKTSATLCGTDDQGWRKGSNFAAMDLAVEEVNDFRADAYAIWVATLITLDDKETRLSAAGRGRVGSSPVVGLKVARRPWPEVVLWFDDKTGLLRKMAYRSREAGATLNKEMTYDGHKEAGGLMVPTRHTISIQGREVYNWKEMEYTFPDRIEPDVFTKPK
ncbi:MAG TPA: hypothetical protein VKD90_08305 [Gemmataceae bacterium]|nr:hypothetical protein [Gemmataceae bacterium]